MGGMGGMGMMKRPLTPAPLPRWGRGERLRQHFCLTGTVGLGGGATFGKQSA
jgi:hypothetical protein